MTVDRAPLLPGSNYADAEDRRPSKVWADRLAKEEPEWTNPTEDEDGFMTWHGSGGNCATWTADPDLDVEETDTPSDRLPGHPYRRFYGMGI